MDQPLPIIASRRDWTIALRWAFSAAIAEGARRIVCCDPDFSDWPLDEPAVLDGLTAWARRPQRSLVLLASDYEPVRRRQPRFTAWRSNWAHVIDARQPPAELAPDLPSLLLDDGTVLVRLLDAASGRGRAALGARQARQHAEALDAVLQRSPPSFALHTLGL